MTDLTEDERELLRLLKDYSRAWGFTPSNMLAAGDAILAHYRRAKAEASDCPRCAKMLPVPPSKPWPKEPEGGGEKSHFATEEKKEE